MHISIRKSFITNKNGECLPARYVTSNCLPSSSEQLASEVNQRIKLENGSLLAKIAKVEQQREHLNVDLEQMKLDRVIADKSKSDLKRNLERVSKHSSEKELEILL